MLQGIREVIERLSLEKDKREGINTKSDIDYNSGSLLQPTVVSGSPVVSSVVSGYEENKMTMIHVHKKGDSHSLLSNFRSFPLIELISGWIASHGYSSRCDKLLCVLSQQKTTFTGAAVVFLMIALYKQKHNISRYFIACSTSRILVICWFPPYLWKYYSTYGKVCSWNLAATRIPWFC